MTVTGKPLGENIAAPKVYERRRHPPARQARLDEPTRSPCSRATSRPMAASSSRRREPRLLKHTGPALVFDDYPMR
jgi:hypothetical protein